MLFGTEFLIFATYIPLNFLYELCVPPKETTKAAMSEEEIQAQAALQEAKQKAAAKAEAIENGKGAIDLEAESGADQQNDKSSIHFPDEENNDNNEWLL